MFTRPAASVAPPRGAPIGDRLPLLVTHDERLVEAVLAAGASVGIGARVADDHAAVSTGWRSAFCVIVGADLAALVASLGLPPRPGVHLVGDDRDELLSWSVPLDASVVVLPGQRTLLASILDPRLDDGVGPGRLVRVIGASGGVGASTLAAGLAQAGSRRSLASVVVELDPCGGGLDLLLGAESVPGWRWNDLRGASGRIESLADHLPTVSGVDVLAMSRPVFALPRPRLRRAVGAAPGVRPLAPSPDAVRSVVAALTRSHRLVVLDTGHAPGGVGDPWTGSRTLMVVAAHPRGIVAASARLAQLAVSDVSLVVRCGPGRDLDPDTVSRAVERPVVGVVHDDRRLRAFEAVGDPPGRAHGRFRREVERLLAGVIDGD